MSKVSIVSGGFDPVHSGHINLMLAAKELGDELIVLLNSDRWLENKKGKPFMNFFERCLLYTSPSPRDRTRSRMPSSA